MTARAPARSVWLVGAAARREAWLAAVRGRVWSFDRALAFGEACVALAPSREPFALYLAAGAVLDVAEGRPPTQALPASWRAWPDSVKTALGLPGSLSAWTRVRAEPLGPEAEAARGASLLAWACEDAGDERGRAMFAEAAARRAGVR